VEDEAAHDRRDDDTDERPERPVVHLFDGHVLVFRAYYVMPSMEAPDGTPTGAVYGFARAVRRHLERARAAHAAVCFDHAMTSFRNELLPTYKAQRGAPPPDLEAQFALCEDVSRAIGVPAFSRERYEADDLLATLASGLLREGADVRIVSTDKDLAQLVREDGRISLHDPAKDAVIDADAVRARFGVDPAQIPDYLALVGDAVDNLPGVPGFGAKSAAAALRRFGTIERIPDDAARWADTGVRGAARLAASLAAHRARALEIRALATVERAVPGVAASLAALRLRGAPGEESRALFERLGWRTEGALGRGIHGSRGDRAIRNRPS
jgi:5'-3' exonuclease